MKRKLVSVILCLSFVFGIFPLQIAFANDYTLIYKIENGAVTITGLSDPSYSGDVVIPELLEGYAVTSISNNAFKNCSFSSVSLPSSVTSINNWAFDGCSGLKKTNYLGSLSEWLNISFGTVNANPTAYSHNLYINDEQITDLVIPEGTTTIKGYSFEGCTSFQSVTIPSSVTSINNWAFDGCSGLKKTNYLGSMNEWLNISFGTVNANPIRYSHNLYIDDKQITDYVIDNGPTTIKGYSFEGYTDLKTITIPKSITSIYNWAFDGCSNLTDVYYGSTAGDFGNISIGNTGNSYFTKATKHFGYTITWVCDGQTYTITAGIPGETITLPDEPQKAGYTFNGWENVPEVMPNESITIEGSFKANTYIAKIFVDGELFDEIPYTYGQKSIDLPAVPKKTGYSGSWSNYELGVGGTMINAIYKPNTYTVTFIADGIVVKTFSFAYGSTSVSEPAVPEKEGHFGKWENYSLGSENITVNAIYTKKQYYITWVVNGKKTNVLYYYGDAIKLPAAPEYDGHTFVKWSPEVPSTMPAKNLVFTAQFKLTNSASVEIVNYNKYNGTTQDYKSSITFKANVKYGHDLNWHVNGANYTINADKSCTVIEATDDYSIYCTVLDADGNEVRSKTETIKIKHSFFDKLIAFFIGLFGSFKKIEQ